MQDNFDRENDIAIIGMAGRFPGARNVEELWNNLSGGVESITFFSDDELLAAGVSPAAIADGNYVKAASMLENIDLFDASFFGYYPREAELIDPQQRLFLQCAWEIMEQVGYSSDAYEKLVGVYAGVGANRYIMNLFANRSFISSTNVLNLAIGNDKDHLCTRVSYKLNLKGPGFSVQTACSTSLVALHLACQGLLNGECDMALAGGVSIKIPQKAGYLYQEGSIASPDGHCRTFDADANGTIGGSGVALVALKRLEDALADGDTVHAVIKGSAINNDGANKVGYAAPSIDGQAEVISQALAVSGIHPETISYIEAHGTATRLGDPIEVAALTQAYRAHTKKKGYCAIGTIKTNFGHLDAAAGVTGLIKTVLALKHGMLPPSLNFKKPNPMLDLANSPFFVNTELSGWERGQTPRRAGVSSFGIGGTNAHVILEEAPEVEESNPARASQLLLISAKTATALDAATANLAAHLRNNSHQNIADAAFTLQTGRRAFEHRRMLVCRDAKDAAHALEQLDPSRLLSSFREEAEPPPLTFMFSGQGTQYVDMGRGLYEGEPAFRRWLDRCAELLKPHLGLDLRSILYPPEAEAEAARHQLEQTFITQPALFCVEYALAQLWMEWGARPGALVGYSIGEYVAACLAGVMSLEDALRLVAARGRLMQSLAPGAMLSVPLPEDELRALLGEDVDVAAVSGPNLSVASGTFEAIERLQSALERRGTASRRLHISHAFHSRMMEPVLADFAAEVKKVKLSAPKIPYISNLTGRWIKADEATDPNYWTKHLREPVRFNDSLKELFKEGRASLLLEIGPGNTLCALAQAHHERTPKQFILPTLRDPSQEQADVAFALNTLGSLWLAGARIDWQAFYKHERRRRVALPTYPFEGRRFWVDPDPHEQPPPLAVRTHELRKREDIAEWFYAPSWKRSRITPASRSTRETPEKPSTFLLFMDETGNGEELAGRLKADGQRVYAVVAGESFAQQDENLYTVNPARAEDYESLLLELLSKNETLDQVVHLWGVTPPASTERDAESVATPNGEVEVFDEAQRRGFYSLLFLAQALSKYNFTEPLRLNIVTDGAHEAVGTENLRVEKSTVLALCKVLPQEYSNIICCHIDIAPPEAGTNAHTRLADDLFAELFAGANDFVVAYRGGYRWVQVFEPLPLGETVGVAPRLREGGTYLITGGMGNVGLALAGHLARSVGARVVLTGRADVPPRDEWEGWLESHDGQDRTGRKIRGLLEIEREGGEAFYVKADVTNPEEMKAALAAVEERFGQLHGVIHAAGVMSRRLARSIEEISRDECEQQLQPKTHGLIVLEQILRGRDLDFCVLLSSLSAVLGGLGMVAYTAANIYMDAFAHRQRRESSFPWVSINWDGWWFREQPVESVSGMPALAELAMLPKEGVEAFERILGFADSPPQVVVSTGDLPTRINQWIKLESLRDAARQPENASVSSRYPRPSLPNPYVAPASELEQSLADIWQLLLGIDKLGVHDKFFDLGGHSLLAVQILSRIRELTHLEIPIRTFFEAETIAALAEQVTRAQSEPQALKLPPITLAPRDKNLPLSSSQRRLWFMDQLEPGSHFFNCPSTVRLKGTLNIPVLERALSEVVRRHEVLRTAYPIVDGQPIQLINPPSEVRLPVNDLSHLPPGEEREATVHSLIKKASQRSFDLARGPMLYVELLRLDEQEHVLNVTMHHIVADAWSTAIFINELMMLYQAFEKSAPSPLPELTLQYADYACWQQNLLQGEGLEAEIKYWKERLGGKLPVLNLPVDHPRQSIQTHRGARHKFTLSPELSDAVRSLSRQESATLFMTLLAAFKTLMHHYTKLEDLIVGTANANRNHGETEKLIGFFINMLVLRTDLSGNPSFRELVARVKRVTLDAYAHQELPFERIVEELKIDRDSSHTPIFQVTFGVENAFQTASAQQPSQPSETNIDTNDDDDAATLSVVPVPLALEASRYDLTLWVKEGREHLSGWWNYNTALFEASTIARISRHFETLLKSIVAAPDAELDKLEMLDEEEKEQQQLKRKSHQEARHKRLLNIKPQTLRMSTGEQQ